MKKFFTLLLMILLFVSVSQASLRWNPFTKAWIYFEPTPSPFSGDWRYNQHTKKQDYYESASSAILGDIGDVTLTGTARGDILYRGATAWLNLAKGTTGQFLIQGANDPAWGSSIPSLTVTNLQASGTTLLIQDDAAQDIKLFASVGAGENPSTWFYGDDSGNPKYGRLYVNTSGNFTINSEKNTLVNSGTTGYLQQAGVSVAAWSNVYFEIQDNKQLNIGADADYQIKFNTTTNLLEGVDAGTCTGASLEYGSWIVKKTVNYDDASPVVCATVADGYIVTDVYVEITTVWDGNGTIEIGDGADPNGFLPDAAITQTGAGYYGKIHQNRGAYLWDGTGDDEELYTGADTVDATLVVGTSTQGVAVVYVKITRLK